MTTLAEKLAARKAGIAPPRKPLQSDITEAPKASVYSNAPDVAKAGESPPLESPPPAEPPTPLEPLMKEQPAQMVAVAEKLALPLDNPPTNKEEAIVQFRELCETYGLFWSRAPAHAYARVAACNKFLNERDRRDATKGMT